MVKIVSRKSLGTQAVYDLGVAQDHNFLLANGIVASNCFNKSHSTAYAYVTYQTAYLKANYPTEYMTALLTASSGNQDKIDKYRENCQRMGIDVLAPDINRSQNDFVPFSQEKQILFGLSAVKNLGQAAIENILEARNEAEGKFESLADFCNRVDLRVVNSRALETLIYCGAFDGITPNRRQLINDLEVLVPWAQQKTKERASGQMNLFDMMSSEETEQTEESFQEAPSAPPVEDYPLQEKLKLEKEYLGFYITDHPLKAATQAAQILSPINLNQLAEQNSRQKVSVVVMLTAVKRIITKKGTPMAFLSLEDITTGDVEGTVFPSTYEKIESLLQENARLIIWGKVQKRDDKYQLIVDDAEPVEQVKMLMLEISPEHILDPSRQYHLKTILQEEAGEKKQGKIPVVAIIKQGQYRQFIRLGTQYWVQDETVAITRLKRSGFAARTEPLVSL
ncbi:MAG: OB-fold nucleic acid binding domain-containing protein [Xenococcus sp. (in: cyanobacteria)]